MGPLSKIVPTSLSLQPRFENCSAAAGKYVVIPLQYNFITTGQGSFKLADTTLNTLCILHCAGAHNPNEDVLLFKVITGSPDSRYGAEKHFKAGYLAIGPCSS